MRILIIGDAPWLPTEDGQQLGELATRLRNDLHSVFFMPTVGMGRNVGGSFSKDGIEFLPVDGENGHEIVKWHVLHTGADIVISRGDASRFDFKGSDFRWMAWHPGRVSNTIIRASRGVLAANEDEVEFHMAQGIYARLFRPAVLPAYSEHSQHDTNYFREAHEIPPDAFLICTQGPTEANHIRLLEAFAEFQRRHPEAVLYLHTAWEGPPDLSAWGLKLGIPRDALRFPDPYNFHCGYPPDVTAAMYAASSVYVNVGKRALPVMESLAVGCPPIFLNLPELAAISEETRGQMGAVLNPSGWHVGEPLLPVKALLAELENAYALRGEALTNHRAVCQMLGQHYTWNRHWHNDWKPYLNEWEAEVKAREERLKYAVIDSAKLDTNIVMQVGDRVRKIDTGGSQRDERAMNAIVKALGPHPNIVPILEEGTDEFGRYYFDTPKGTPLTEFKSFDRETGDRILAEVKAGADFLNAHGIAHRDLNARNVLIMEDGRACIFDFDWIQPGLTPEQAHLCDFEPLDERVREFAVPVMMSNLATRGYHRVVAYVRNLNLEASRATSHPDMPYQKVEGAGERDCSLRWDAFQPEVKGKRVLDLGCNLGYFAARSLEEGAVDVLAVDHDKAVLEAAVKLYPELEGRTLQLELEEAMPAGEWDVAFCLSLWAHLGHGKRQLLDFLKTIPVVYWEDVQLSLAELEQMGFKVTRVGFSELRRNLFKLESAREAVPA